MESDMQKARTLLESGQYTCVLCKADRVLTSALRGVAPLMQLWEQGEDLTDFSAADKVVGKATALLYCLLGVRRLYAGVISRPALSLLQSHRIETQYSQLVDAIINRTGDGFCPMETATMDIQDPAQAPAAIKRTLQLLNGQ